VRRRRRRRRRRWIRSAPRPPGASPGAREGIAEALLLLFSLALLFIQAYFVQRCDVFLHGVEVDKTRLVVLVKVLERIHAMFDGLLLHRDESAVERDGGD
jgi:hypothetical protein